MKNFKYNLVALCLRPFSFLPLRCLQALGGFLGRHLIQFNKKRLHITQRNIAVCFPTLSKDAQHSLLIKTAEEAGKWFFESPFVWYRNPQFLAKKVTVINPELLAAAHANNKGVIIILPHLGNFEFINYYLPFHYDFASMYKPIRSKLVEDMVFNGRSRVGTSMFGANKKGVRSAFKHLKQGKVLAVLSDHLPSRDAGVFAPFFGVPAHTGKLAHSLAKFNHSKVLLASVIRLPKGRGFELCFYPIEGMDCEDPVESTTIMNKAMEACIRPYPEQYQWVYRRFSRQPEGSPQIY